MEEVRQLVQEEGREARNLVAFHVAVDTPAPRTSRKPPRCASASSGSISSNSSLLASIPTCLPRPDAATRLRSASAGRDKRSDLQARYWALLFGNLRRAIGEIYATVEAHENLSECKEVILVLENYTRDFKSLCEWFQLKWEYDNTPPPQRPQSLAWEVRKIDFVKPERKTYSIRSSSSGSGKNSPCISGRNTPCLLSGKNSPNLLTTKSSPNTASGKISPRITAHSCTSPKSSNMEFFNSKISSGKCHIKSGLKDTVTKLADLKENEVVSLIVDEKQSMDSKSKQVVLIELGTASKELPNLPCAKPVVLQRIGDKNDTTKNNLGIKKEMSIQAKQTIESLNAMENDFLKATVVNNNKEIKEFQNDIQKQVSSVNVGLKSDNLTKICTSENIAIDDKVQTKKLVKIASKTSGNESSKEIFTPIKLKKPQMTGIVTKNTTGIQNIGKNLKIFDKNDSTKDIGDKPAKKITLSKSDETISKLAEEAQNIDATKTELKPLIVKPAYSQAAAKPKIISNKTIIDKTNSNTKNIATNRPALSRSNTIAEIRQNSSRNVNSNRQLLSKRTGPNTCSYPFNLTGRSTFFDANGSTAKTLNTKSNIKVRDNLMRIHRDANDKKNMSGKPMNKTTKNKSISTKPFDISLSVDSKVNHSDSFKIQPGLSEKRKADNQDLIDANELFGNSIEVLNVENDNQDSQVGGWFTVKSKRASSRKHTKSQSHWANRFNQPSATSSLPTLNMLDSPKDEHFKLKDFESKTKEEANNKSEESVVGEKPFDSEGPRETKNEVEEKHSVIEKSAEMQSELEEKNWDSQRSVEVEMEGKYKSGSESVEIGREVESKLSDSEQYFEIKNKFEIKSSITEETDKIINVKTNEIDFEEKPTERFRKIVKSKDRSFDKKKQSMIRQRSDVTGYKTRGSRNRLHMKALNGKSKYKPEQNRLHSSLESLCGLNSQETTEGLINFHFTDKLRTLSFNYLEDEDRLLNKSSYFEESDPLEMSEIAKMTSQIEENERKISLALDFLSEEDQRKLCEEEEQLNRQIQELQRGSDVDLEIDTETDDPETDGETHCEDCLQNVDLEEDPLCGGNCSYVEGHLGPLASSLEDQYDSVLAGMSWAERVDTLATLEALVARHPGRAQQLHAKLSQGIRRGSLQETLKRYQSKQARAQQQRTELRGERTHRLHQLLARVEDVKTAKNHLIEEKRVRMEQRLQKAAQLRDQHLKDIVRKAHEEGAKLREIAFITQLQAEHRRLDHLQQWREQTDRLRQIRRDRLLRLEQKAAREAAVGERREALEAARQLKVQQVLEQRKQRDARVLQRRAATLERQHNAALEKARGRDERLSALAAAQQAEVRALRLRIRDKQRGTEERHARNLAAIRQRATKTQTISESHETSGKAECVNESVDQVRCDLPKDKLKSFKKKMKKLRQRIHASGEEFERKFDQLATEANTTKTKIGKTLLHISTLLQRWNATNNNQNIPPTKGEVDGNNVVNITTRGNSISSCSSDTGSKGGTKEINCSTVSLDSLERYVNELWRIVDKFRDGTERRSAGILQVLGRLVGLAAEDAHFYTQIQTKSLVTVCLVIHSVLVDCAQNVLQALHSNLSLHLADVLFKLMGEEIQEESREQQLVQAIADILSTILNAINVTSAAKSNQTKDQDQAKVHKQGRKGKKNAKEEAKLGETEDESKIGFNESRTRCNSIICYVFTGASTRPAWWSCARRTFLRLITAAAGVCSYSYLDTPGCAWSVSARSSLSEAILRGSGAATAWCDVTSAPGSSHTRALLSCMRAVAERLPKTFQEAMGVEGAPLQFRAFAAKLLQQYAPTDDLSPQSEDTIADNESLLKDLITVIGYFLVNNERHQVFVTDLSIPTDEFRSAIDAGVRYLEVLWSGPAPGVVRALAALPAHWAGRAPLAPALRAAAGTERARRELANDMCVEMLDEYLESAEAEHDQLARLIKRGTWEDNT